MDESGQADGRMSKTDASATRCECNQMLADARCGLKQSVVLLVDGELQTDIIIICKCHLVDAIRVWNPNCGCHFKTTTRVMPANEGAH